MSAKPRITFDQFVLYTFNVMNPSNSVHQVNCCTICNRYFVLGETKQLHNKKKSHTSTKKKLFCCVCDLQCNSSVSFAEHIISSVHLKKFKTKQAELENEILEELSKLINNLYYNNKVPYEEGLLFIRKVNKELLLMVKGTKKLDDLHKINKGDDFNNKPSEISAKTMKQKLVKVADNTKSKIVTESVNDNFINKLGLACNKTMKLNVPLDNSKLKRSTLSVTDDFKNKTNEISDKKMIQNFTEVVDNTTKPKIVTVSDTEIKINTSSELGNDPDNIYDKNNANLNGTVLEGEANKKNTRKIESNIKDKVNIEASGVQDGKITFNEKLNSLMKIGYVNDINKLQDFIRREIFSEKLTGSKAAKVSVLEEFETLINMILSSKVPLSDTLEFLVKCNHDLEPMLVK